MLAALTAALLSATQPAPLTCPPGARPSPETGTCHFEMQTCRDGMIMPSHRACPAGQLEISHDLSEVHGETNWIASFAANSAVLTPRTRATLDRFAAGQAHLTGDAFAVTGHADSSERHPAALSRRRGESVRAYLISKGLPPSSIRVDAVGATQPLDITHDHRTWNRRIQIRIRY